MLGWQTEILMVSRAVSEAGGQTHTNWTGGGKCVLYITSGLRHRNLFVYIVLFICVRSVSLSVADNSEPQYACDRTECRPLLTRQPWILSDTQPGNTHSILFLSLRGCVWSMFGRKLSAPAPPCVSGRHFHAGLFLMEAQRRDDIWGATDTELKIDILWLYECLTEAGFGQQTNRRMFSSCVTAADTRLLPPPLCFHWHPCMTFSVFLLEIVLLYSKTTKCVHTGACFLRADWPGWEFPVLLRIHETWKEMMGGGTRTPSGQELEQWTVDVAVFSSL